jgi:hypothetical protein
MPVFIFPDKLNIYGDFLASSFIGMMVTPKIAFKVNLSFGYLRLIIVL